MKKPGKKKTGKKTGKKIGKKDLSMQRIGLLHSGAKAHPWGPSQP
jgi:hypothetical protein